MKVLEDGNTEFNKKSWSDSQLDKSPQQTSFLSHNDHKGSQYLQIPATDITDAVGGTFYLGPDDNCGVVLQDGHGSQYLQILSDGTEPSKNRYSAVGEHGSFIRQDSTGSQYLELPLELPASSSSDALLDQDARTDTEATTGVPSFSFMSVSREKKVLLVAIGIRQLVCRN